MTSWTLEPPKGHMSSSFLALPNEDITQQPLCPTHSLLYSGKGWLMESSFLPHSFFSLFHGISLVPPSASSRSSSLPSERPTWEPPQASQTPWREQPSQDQ